MKLNSLFLLLKPATTGGTGVKASKVTEPSAFVKVLGGLLKKPTAEAVEVTGSDKKPQSLKTAVFGANKTSAMTAKEGEQEETATDSTAITKHVNTAVKSAKTASISKSIEAGVTTKSDVSAGEILTGEDAESDVAQGSAELPDTGVDDTDAGSAIPIGVKASVIQSPSVKTEQARKAPANQKVEDRQSSAASGKATANPAVKKSKTGTVEQLYPKNEALDSAQQPDTVELADETAPSTIVTGEAQETSQAGATTISDQSGKKESQIVKEEPSSTSLTGSLRSAAAALLGLIKPAKNRPNESAMSTKTDTASYGVKQNPGLDNTKETASTIVLDQGTKAASASVRNADKVEAKDKDQGGTLKADSEISTETKKQPGIRTKVTGNLTTEAQRTIRSTVPESILANAIGGDEKATVENKSPDAPPQPTANRATATQSQAEREVPGTHHAIATKNHGVSASTTQSAVNKQQATTVADKPGPTDSNPNARLQHTARSVSEKVLELLSTAESNDQVSAVRQSVVIEEPTQANTDTTDRSAIGNVRTQAGHSPTSIKSADRSGTVKSNPTTLNNTKSAQASVATQRNTESVIGLSAQSEVKTNEAADSLGTTETEAIVDKPKQTVNSSPAGNSGTQSVTDPKPAASTSARVSERVVEFVRTKSSKVTRAYPENMPKDPAKATIPTQALSTQSETDAKPNAVGRGPERVSQTQSDSLRAKVTPTRETEGTIVRKAENTEETSEIVTSSASSKSDIKINAAHADTESKPATPISTVSDTATKGMKADISDTIAKPGITTNPQRKTVTTEQPPAKEPDTIKVGYISQKTVKQPAVEQSKTEQPSVSAKPQKTAESNTPVQSSKPSMPEMAETAVANPIDVMDNEVAQSEPARTRESVISTVWNRYIVPAGQKIVRSFTRIGTIRSLSEWNEQGTQTIKQSVSRQVRKDDQSTYQQTKLSPGTMQQAQIVTGQPERKPAQIRTATADINSTLGETKGANSRLSAHSSHNVESTDRPQDTMRSAATSARAPLALRTQNISELQVTSLASQSVSADAEIVPAVAQKPIVSTKKQQKVSQQVINVKANSSPATAEKASQTKSNEASAELKPVATEAIPERRSTQGIRTLWGVTIRNRDTLTKQATALPENAAGNAAVETSESVVDVPLQESKPVVKAASDKNLLWNTIKSRKTASHNSATQTGTVQSKDPQTRKDIHRTVETPTTASILPRNTIRAESAAIRAESKTEVLSANITDNVTEAAVKPGQNATQHSTDREFTAQVKSSTPQSAHTPLIKSSETQQVVNGNQVSAQSSVRKYVTDQTLQSNETKAVSQQPISVERRQTPKPESSATVSNSEVARADKPLEAAPAPVLKETTTAPRTSSGSLPTSTAAVQNSIQADPESKLTQDNMQQQTGGGMQTMNQDVQSAQQATSRADFATFIPRLTAEDIRELQALVQKALASSRSAVNDSREVRFEWSQKELGNVRFLISTNDSDVKVTIQADRTEVAEAIEKSKAVVERMITDQGLRVERFEVQLRVSSDPQMSSHNFAEQQQAKEQAANTRQPASANTPETDNPIPEQTLPRRNSLQGDREWVA